MSYTPTEWKKGDVITATKLNKIENGIAAINVSPLIVTVTVSDDNDSTYHTCDKTWNEIKTAFESGRLVWFYSFDDSGGTEITSYYIMSGLYSTIDPTDPTYNEYACSDVTNTTYTTNDPNDYPKYAVAGDRSW